MYVTSRACMSGIRQGGAWRRRVKPSTWSTCCVFLSELVSLLQLVKSPLICVLRGHDKYFFQEEEEDTFHLPLTNFHTENSLRSLGYRARVLYRVVDDPFPS